jgi:uncharacterized protein with HEPN domain
MNDRDRLYLRDMLDAAREAISFGEGQTLEKLGSDRKLALALAQEMAIIGEAAGRVSREVAQSAPGIPWPQIVSMRNRLIHGYREIDFEVGHGAFAGCAERPLHFVYSRISRPRSGDALARIPRDQVPDLPDLVIAGTALALGLPLVTRDGKIRSSDIQAIWGDGRRVIWDALHHVDGPGSLPSPVAPTRKRRDHIAGVQRIAHLCNGPRVETTSALARSVMIAIQILAKLTADGAAKLE